MPKQNVPALRLHGFSGEWEDCTLGEHSHVTTGSSDVQDADPDGLYPFFVRSQHVERSNKYLFDGEAILIPGEGRLGEIFHYYIGKFDFHQRVYRISDFEDVDGKYVYWAMQHSFKDHAMQNTVKATVDSLRQPTITGFVFQKPPTLEEQQAIGAVFTNLDAAINQHTLKHKALQQSKTALMQRMFPQEGQTVPELRLEGFSGEWEVSPLSEISELNPSASVPAHFEYVDLASVLGTEMISHQSTSSSEAPSRAQRVARYGDIFYQTVRPYQKNNYHFMIDSDCDFVFSTGYAQIRPLIDGEFLFTAVQREDFLVQVLDRCTGTGYPAIAPNALGKIQLSYPPTLEEQQAIGAIFTNLDQLIAAEAQYIESLKQAKAALLQRMFI